MKWEKKKQMAAENMYAPAAFARKDTVMVTAQNEEHWHQWKELRRWNWVEHKAAKTEDKLAASPDELSREGQ